VSEIATIGIALMLLAAALREHWMLLRVVRPQPLPPRLDQYPSVSVIRPIRGLDCEVEQNIRAGLDTGYPGRVETIFVFDDVDEPALSIARRVIAEREAAGHRDRVEIVFCGQPPPDQTGKLNAMIVGMARATGELIAFADSDIRSDRDTLRIMVETLLTTDRAGSAFPSVVVSEPPRTAGDVGALAMLNSLYAPLSAILARRRGGDLPFILGQYMVFERETLENRVGLREMRGQLVDDLHIGRLVEEAGLRNIIAPCSLRIISHGLDRTQSLDLYTRWLMYSRSGMPEWSYKIPSVVRASLYVSGLILGVHALLQGLWLAAALAFGSSLIVNHTMIAIHRSIGGAAIPRKWWLIPGAFFLLVPFLFLRIYTQRQLNWRGRVYALDSSARLDLHGDPPSTSRLGAAEPSS
jgi:cellulose synthase/poly-beta-1,6-N-acetylglucosamine synthase-like glycosyltransferase